MLFEAVSEIYREVEVQMKINGGRVISVSGERIDQGKFEGFDINIQLTDIREVEKRFEIQFEQATNYRDKFAKMNIVGVVYGEADDKERKKMVEDWKKTKKLPNETMEEVLMSVQYITGTVGTLLAFALNINAPINVPKTRVMDMPGQPAQKAG